MKLKYLILFVATITLFNSCKKDADPVSKWKLIEQLMDPGDGSGVFVAVNSSKTISFFEDGTVTSTGDLCQMSIESGVGSTGVYSEVDQMITPDICGTNGYPLNYEFEGSDLILNYPCIEPCREKYEPVQ